MVFPRDPCNLLERNHPPSFSKPLAIAKTADGSSSELSIYISPVTVPSPRASSRMKNTVSFALPMQFGGSLGAEVLPEAQQNKQSLRSISLTYTSGSTIWQD